jgi:L-amino acid N-acyltransferase YncA
MIEFETLDFNRYPAAKKIYELGIATGNATFQSEAPSWEEWEKNHLSECRIVLLDNNLVLGWAALTPVSGRCVYSGVAEVSIYIHPDYHGKGLGKGLLSELIRQSEKAAIWTLQAGIFPENVASMKLHVSVGFREIGYRERIGKMNDVWRNTILLERRSNLVGI